MEPLVDAARARRRALLAGGAVLAALAAAWALGLAEQARPERFRAWIEAWGPLGPAVFIAGYVLAELLFVPALPLTLLGGIAFGPLWGTAYVSVASTLGAAGAFLLARHALRDLVRHWMARSPALARLDRAVAEHGWRMLVVTRLVPLFPFNLQNFAYGLTPMPFATFVGLSWLCMLPGTAAYTLAAGALAEGGGSPGRTLALLGAAGVLLVLLSLVPGRLRRRGLVAVGALALGAASAATLAAAGARASAVEPAPGESAAYARLLAAHVRPVTIAGIRLHGVDYQALRRDPDYPQALRELAAVRPEALPADQARLAFWINAYNLLAIKAVIDQYPTRSIRDGGSLFRSIWKKPIALVAGQERALDDVEHGILRPVFAEPRVHFAIVCASLSCPDLRPEPYRAADLEAQLEDATRRFLQNPTKGVRPGPDGRTARVSSIFKWFPEDFARAGGVAAFIRARAGAPLAGRVQALTDAGLSYLDYDWSLNDASR
jgi:uncharacterized membrane protein YdjX (TVP38/TMEM64 family)